jgi:hypothetical protein
VDECAEPFAECLFLLHWWPECAGEGESRNFPAIWQTRILPVLPVRSVWRI